MFLNRFFRRKNDSRTDLYRKIALSFFSISVVIAVIVFLISFSWATVSITPIVKQLTDTVSLTVQEEPVSTSGAVPGKIIRQELEASGTFTPTAVSTVEDKAAGSITVANTSGRPQQLRATTRFLSTANVLFRSTEFVTVPAQGSIDVPVIADIVGDPGDLQRERFTLPGLHADAQAKIYGTSFTKGGGGSREVRAVTETDITNAEAELLRKLQEKFNLMLDAEKTKVNAPAVASAIKSSRVSHTSDRAVGDQAKEFTLTVKVEFIGVLYDEQRFAAALHQSLLTHLSTRYQLIDPQMSDITSTVLLVDDATRSATISSRVTAGKMRTDDLQPYQKKDLAGLSREDIVTYFRGYDDISDVSVSLYPFWVTRAPLLVDHITIRIQK